MPFLSIYLRKQNKIILRKEKDADISLTKRKSSHKSVKKASIFASLPGSITLETALIVPFFFLALVCLLYLIEIMTLQVSVKEGLRSAGKEAAEQVYGIPAVITSKVEEGVRESAGRERLDNSLISGGASGIDCHGSWYSMADGIVYLKAVYEVRLPIPVMRIPPVRCEEKIRVKAWTGYQGGGLEGILPTEIVYVTETGIVYHKNPHCTYLEPSVRQVSANSVEELRNSSGGKYYPCHSCGNAAHTGHYYITDTGDRYHTSAACSKLQRIVYAVEKSEVRGKGACSKCSR